MTHLSAQRSTQEYQSMDAAHHIHAFLDQKQLNAEKPRVITKGHGAYVEDSDGNKYLDGMSGLWCTNIGYGRKDLVAAAAQQMEDLSY
jgi:adenosylmethionine-8-amino-7-oxononanoate aminotransferase